MVTSDEILDVFAEETNVDRALLTPEATLESLNIASIDIISVSFAIEDKFGVVLETDDFAATQTLAQVVAMVISKSQASGKGAAASPDVRTDVARAD